MRTSKHSWYSGHRTSFAPVPEGHTIHRYARLHRRDLSARAVHAWSPQGRFADGAAELDGRTLDTVDARGKHLFYRWEGGLILHVHLGLFGRFTAHRSVPAPTRTDGTRLAMATPDVAIHLSGPTDCRLIDEDDEAAIRTRLGPDPIADRRKGLPSFADHMGRRSVGIGAALLDQKAVAGIGNVYRAEALFLEGIHPTVRARDLTDDELASLWDRLVSLLRAGERAGRILTVDPVDVGASRASELDRDERLYVYKRGSEPCRRCRTPIVRWELAGRSIWACQSCQPVGRS